MTDREKLIALIQAAVNGCSTYWAGLIADYLLANGVTFATDNHVGGKWIPVTERLPEDGQTVIACVTHRFGDKSIIPMVFWHESYFHWQDVTHWMPLPEPPKEEV